MVKLSKYQINNYLDFLNEFKCLVGFSDWGINLTTKVGSYGEKTLALVGVCIWEKELTVELTEEFLKKPIIKQHNILMHELVHGRVRYYKERLKEFEEIEEEHLVNDLTRGIETLCLSEKLK